jgi:hypothetical protein
MSVDFEAIMSKKMEIFKIISGSGVIIFAAVVSTCIKRKSRPMGYPTSQTMHLEYECTNISAYYSVRKNNSHISKGDYKQMVRGSTKKFYFPNVDIKKVFYFGFSKLYRPNGGREGR